jgi:hypothetical protein
MNPARSLLKKAFEKQERAEDILAPKLDAALGCYPSTFNAGHHAIDGDSQAGLCIDDLYLYDNALLRLSSVVEIKTSEDGDINHVVTAFALEIYEGTRIDKDEIAAYARLQVACVIEEGEVGRWHILGREPIGADGESAPVVSKRRDDGFRRLCAAVLNDDQLRNERVVVSERAAFEALRLVGREDW